MKTTEEKRNSQKWKQLGFQKGDVRKVCFKERANIRREEARKRKTKETHQRVFSKKGLMDKKLRKNGILKGKTKGKRQACWGNKIEKKTLNLQENSPCGPFAKQKHKNTKEKKQNRQKTKKAKNRPKTPFHFGKQPPTFDTFCFFHVTLFQVCKAVFAENAIKIVFSAEHSF